MKCTNTLLTAFVLLFAATVCRAQTTHTFSYQGDAFQQYIVPASGIYFLDVSGAQGGDASNVSHRGGLGARMQGYVQLQAGDTLRISVGRTGGKGVGATNNVGGGGGGGASAIVKVNGAVFTPLLIAGGGGGGASNNNGLPGLVSQNGGLTWGGTNGNGGGLGSNSSKYGGAGGAGYYTDGQTHCDGNCTGSNVLSYGGQAYLSGNNGGCISIYGGCGGWGGGGQGGRATSGVNSNNDGGGGGGGGWSGGGGGRNQGDGGGGGGSFANSAFNIIVTLALEGVNQGNGFVFIEKLVPSPFSTSGEITSTFSYSGSLFQNYYVPESGWYKCEVGGGQGGNSGFAVGGAGAKLDAYYFFNQNDHLKILVGGRGGTGVSLDCYPTDALVGGGGGGASSIYNLTDQSLVLMAGGGGGASGGTGTDGVQGTAQSGLGEGGLANGASFGGSGGGGYFSDGADGDKCFGGQAYVNGAQGGTVYLNGNILKPTFGNGAFGSGGRAGTTTLCNDYTGGGGGGGFSGGEGGDKNSPGTGGSSFFKGGAKNLSRIDGANYNLGSVIITGPFTGDQDGDAFLDVFDNCPQVFNPDQADVNKDGVGDICQGNLFFAAGNIFKQFIVPVDGYYLLDAKGGQGGPASNLSHKGGLGAHMQGYVELQAGDTLRIAVGTIGSRGLGAGNNVGGGGGGGASSIIKVNGAAYTPLLIAGGGGGGAANYNGSSGLASPSGSPSWGGTNGNGGGLGSNSSKYGGAGGAGYYTDGETHCDGNCNGSNMLSYGGQAYLSGNNGGCISIYGGCGGWGGGGQGGPATSSAFNNNNGGGGGGGGWSGGGGGKNQGDGGGGGGSFVSSSAITQGLIQLAGVNVGDGFVSISGPFFDGDQDGIIDSFDNCPLTANANQSDTDGDGTGDVCDGCPNNPALAVSGVCGCSAPAVDSDNNGVIDCLEGFFNFYHGSFITYTIPADGWYELEAAGGQGGNVGGWNGMQGSYVKGYYYLFQGQQMRISAGQKGADGTRNGNRFVGGGGGGASSIVSFVPGQPQQDRVYVFAGGGGGASAAGWQSIPADSSYLYYSEIDSCDQGTYNGLALNPVNIPYTNNPPFPYNCYHFLPGINQDGRGSSGSGSGAGSGGNSGDGGRAVFGTGDSIYGAAGGGYLNDGVSTSSMAGGKAYSNGNNGGSNNILPGSGGNGGWGGGGQGGMIGSTYYNGGGGGGGGYSGGGGSGEGGWGGRGGSYIWSSSFNNYIAAKTVELFRSINEGDGWVRITPAYDDDGDRVFNDEDNCRYTANIDQYDDDFDGVGNSCDVCPENADYKDSLTMPPSYPCGCSNDSTDVNLNGVIDCEEGLFGNYVTQKQGYRVPSTGWYLLELNGAQGGNIAANPEDVTPYQGGEGASLQGWFKLTANDSLDFIVGEQGGDGVCTNCGLLSNWTYELRYVWAIRVFGAPIFLIRNTIDILGGGCSKAHRSGAGGGGATFAVNISNNQEIMMVAGGGGGAGKVEHGKPATPNLSGDASGGNNPGKAGAAGGEPVISDKDDLSNGAGGGGFQTSAGNISNTKGKFAALGGGGLISPPSGKSRSMGGDGGFGGGGEGGIPKCGFLNSLNPDIGSGGGGGGGGFSGGGNGLNGGKGGGGGGSKTFGRFIYNLQSSNTGHGMASIKGPFPDSDSNNVPDTLQGSCVGQSQPDTTIYVSCTPPYAWYDGSQNLIAMVYDSDTYYHYDTSSCRTLILIYDAASPTGFFLPGSHAPCSTLTRKDTTVVICQPFTWSRNNRTYNQSVFDSVRINCNLWYINLVIGPPVATSPVQGPEQVCKNATVTYYIPAAAGASSYQWTLPPRASGFSTTNSITVGFPGNFAGGQLSVIPVNHCGNGSAVTIPISVANTVPTGRMTIVGPVPPAVSGAYSVNAIAGADTYTWSVSTTAAMIISGQGTTSIELQVQPGYTGTLVLQVVASNCKGNGSRTTKPVVVLTPVRSQDPALMLNEQKLMVYPNPNNGVFIVKTMSFTVDARLEIYSMDGRLVRNALLPANTMEMSIDLLQPVTGLYQVRLVAGDEVRSVKVIVQ